MTRYRTAMVLLVSVMAALPVAVGAQAERSQPAALTADREWTRAPIADPAQAYRLHSEVLGEERRIFVTLPPSHAQTTRQYPVILAFDGESLLGTVAAAAKALTTAGYGPEAVVVAIENTDRLRDLSPPGLSVSGNNGSGRADLFLDFLERELRPVLVERFRGGGPIFLVGHSSGGLFVAYAAATRPETFGSVLALDAPMHLGDGSAAEPLLRLAESGDAAVNLVSMEAGLGWPQDAWDATVAAAPASWRLFRDSYPGENHQSIPWPATYAGLKQLFASFAPVVSRGTSPVERLAAYDAARFAGGTVPPAEIILRSALEDQIIARDIEGAKETLVRLVDGYGESDRTRALADEMTRAEADALEGPSVEEMKAAPRASPAEVEAVVGEWEGVMLMEGISDPSVVSLSVRIEDGVPVGEIILNGAPPNELEYVAVDGGEIHLGHMNGMRPRGMLVYEGTVSGDVYEGLFVIRGVVFQMPDGREFPVMTFRLERVDPGVR